MAELLIEKNYIVYGIIRRHSSIHTERIDHLFSKVKLIYGDMTDQTSLQNVLNTIITEKGRDFERLEVYNLAAQSFVGISWELNKLTTEVNCMGPLNLLNSIRQHNPNARFYQASTSEMFGNATEPGLQGETTPFRPRSPYGVSKLYSHWMTINFRESYSLYACSGILFNHESPLRGCEFVTRKITDAVARIKLGLANDVTLGNLDSARDWGFAGDFVEAMWLMLQQEKASDYVIATGEQHTIGDLCRVAFEHAGIHDWKHLVKSDPRFKRPAELYSLRGDATRAREQLGWKPRTNFETMIRDMVDADIKRLSV